MLRTTRRCLLIAASSAAAAFGLSLAPAAHGAPYVSCPGGYIAPSLKECPNIPQNRGGARKPPPLGGGGGAGGGLIGDLLGAVGLGGLGGLL